jgi:hypothetical protein
LNKEIRRRPDVVDIFPRPRFPDLAGRRHAGRTIRRMEHRTARQSRIRRT